MRTLFLSFTLIVLLTGLVSAQSSGSNSTTCDGLNGKAFGLCNAYCEAMDCDADFPNASSNACQKKYSKFMEVAGVEPPCESVAPQSIVACPCAGEWWRLDLYPSEYSSAGCGIFEEQDASTILMQFGDFEGPYREIYATKQTGNGDSDHDAMWCLSVSGVDNEDVVEGGFHMENFYPNSPPEHTQLKEALYEACFQQVQELADYFGLECILQ